MKPMHIAMALFSAAMFFVLAGVFMGVQLELHPLAVDLYRYGSGFFLSVAASDVPESGEARLRTEVYSAGDRWLYR